MRYLYLPLSYLLAPLFAGAMLWRGLRERDWWRNFGERLGFGDALGGEPPVWVHAVSVGEVQACVALVRELRGRHPEIPVVITTVTPTGAQRARALLGDAAEVRFLPLDLPGAVARFLDRARPRLGIVLETELWPNLYRACRLRGVPIVLASARLSERSVARYRRLGSLLRETLSAVAVVCAQSARDAERFRDIGADPARIEVTGNIKFDFSVAADAGRRGADLRRAVAAGRPLWVAGSTHAGEEAVLLEAHRLVRARIPDALLAMAPRHPPRFPEVRAWLRREVVRFATRSAGEPCEEGTELLLVDTLGELLALYAAGDVAFVGGSLVPIGGHNLLEPAALARPVLTGPWNFNGPQIAAMLVEHGGARIVTDAPSLAAALIELLGDAPARERMGRLARETLEANGGALARVLRVAEPLL